MRRKEIEQLLPEVFQRTVRPGTPLAGILDVMEALHAPVEALLPQVDMFFNPRSTPDAFVPLLARWVALDGLIEDYSQREDARSIDREPLPTGLGRLRELVAMSAHLAKHRGTAGGLRQFLEIATGAAGSLIEEQVPDQNGEPKPFHIRVRAPVTLQPHQGLLQRIIELEKPAYVTYELEFVPNQAGGP